MILCRILILVIVVSWTPCAEGTAFSVKAFKPIDRHVYQHQIVDLRHQLNPKFKKIERTHTRYIIVHTTETNLPTARKLILKGKQINGRWVTRGGHAHYLIARDGKTYRTLDKRYRSDHAGRSMWAGHTDISSVSIGIELVGYHNGVITDRQYDSLGTLLGILRKIYRLNDKAVLTHSQVAYGRPNRWIKRRHRGRKLCASNFVRQRAGLNNSWQYDPDVRAGRLLPDLELANIYYGNGRRPKNSAAYGIITPYRSAWSIAGKAYRLHSTIYVLPSGNVKTGDQIKKWYSIPSGTILLAGYRGPYVLTSGRSPIRIAGNRYAEASTLYYFPSRKLLPGNKIRRFSRIPKGTLIFLPI